MTEVYSRGMFQGQVGVPNINMQTPDAINASFPDNEIVPNILDWFSIPLIYRLRFATNAPRATPTILANRSNADISLPGI